MSFNPRTYSQVPYGGTPFADTVKVLQPSTLSPRVVQLTLNWLTYFLAAANLPTGNTNISVPVNMEAMSGAQGSVIDKLVSCKIDNSGSDVPISVFFPDTNDMITAPPQSIVCMPCITNKLQCYVIAQNLQSGFTPTTRIAFSNFWIPPFVDPQVQYVYPQWRGSPTIQRSNLLTSGYASPALGDQTLQVLDTIAGTGVIRNNLFGAAVSGTFIYVTHIDVTIVGVNNATSGGLNWVIEDSNSVNVFIFGYDNQYGGATIIPAKILNMNAMQIRLSGALSYRIRCTGYGGSAGFNVTVLTAYNFTINTQ